MSRIKSKDLSKWLYSKDKGPIPPVPQGFDVPWGSLPIPEVVLKVDPGSADTAFEGLQAAHDKAIPRMVKDLSVHLDNMMEAGWGWIDGTRDIVDTGALKSSKKVSASSSGFEVSYSAPYVNIVHYGGYIQPYGNVNIEKVYLPARPWIAATFGKAPGPLPPFDFEQSYYDAMAGYA